MNDYIVVFTSTGNQTEAETITRDLVELRKAASAKVIGPTTSTYRWQGCVEQSFEWQCIVKTRHDLFDEVSILIKQRHSYEVPEIIALPIVAATDDYLAWWDGATGEE